MFILSMFAQDYLRDTDGRDFNLDKLVALDTSGRIAKNFESIEMASRGGLIAIRYKFSGSRDGNVGLTDAERRMTENRRVTEKKSNGDFNGEVQFEYGERSYNFRRIVIRR